MIYFAPEFAGTSLSGTLGSRDIIQSYHTKLALNGLWRLDQGCSMCDFIEKDFHGYHQIFSVIFPERRYWSLI